MSLFIFLSSCTTKKIRKDLTNCITINASLNSEDKFSLSKYSIDVKLIPLETSKECLIGTLQSIIYKNGRFYILSRGVNKILVFNMDGRFFGKLDAVGRGPGEYFRISDFIVDSEGNIFILDMFEIKKYNDQFQFIERYKLKLDEELHPVSFYFTKPRNIYFWNSAYSDQNRNENKYWFYVYDNNKLHGKYLAINYRDFHRKRFYDYSNKLLLSPLRFDYKILRLEGTELIDEYLIDFGKNSVPPKYQSETFSSTNSTNLSEEVINQSVIWNIFDPIETKRFFSFMASKEMWNYQFIYDKKLDKCYNIPYSNDDPLSLYNIRGAIDSSYFSVIEPNRLESYANSDSIIFNSHLDFSENSNPIIIAWTINFKENED